MILGIISKILFNKRVKKYTPIIIEEFGKIPTLGVDPFLGMAFARQESNFNPYLSKIFIEEKNDIGWGLFQLTLSEARAVGFNGKPENLLDPITSIILAAKHIKEIEYRMGINNYKDIASYYRCGEKYQNAPKFVREEYVPLIMGNIAWGKKWLQQNKLA